MKDVELGQLLCVGIRGSDPGDPALERDLDACAAVGVGSIVLFDVDIPTLRQLEADGLDQEEALEQAHRNILGPGQLKTLIAHVRQRVGADVLIGIDQEGGRVARLNLRRGFAADPGAAEFALLPEADQLKAAGAQARQLRELGIDLNFAPCVDLALNPANAVIVGKGRAFGPDPARVIRAAEIVLDAHAREGVAACLKHFPGHGSSRDDTHLGSVDITTTWQRDAELTPYRSLAHRPGVAVMTAHVVHRDLDPDFPASLSRTLTQDLLREELGFDGVVITDSIDMRAIADHWPGPEAAVAAVNAGADLVMDAFNLEARDDHPGPALVAALRSAIDDGRLRGGEARIRESLSRLHRLRQETRRP